MPRPRAIPKNQDLVGMAKKYLNIAKKDLDYARGIQDTALIAGLEEEIALLEEVISDQNNINNLLSQGLAPAAIAQSTSLYLELKDNEKKAKIDQITTQIEVRLAVDELINLGGEILFDTDNGFAISTYGIVSLIAGTITIFS